MCEHSSHPHLLFLNANKSIETQTPQVNVEFRSGNSKKVYYIDEDTGLPESCRRARFTIVSIVLAGL